MMRIRQFIALLAVLLPSASLFGQTSVRLGVGGGGGTRLLGDRVNPFAEVYGVNLTQRKGPALQASVATQATVGYRVRLQADLAATTLDIRDEDTGEINEFGSLKVLTILAMAEGKVVTHLDWQAGVGRVMYLPGEKIGLFQDGGPSRWAVAVGVNRKFSAGPSLAVVLSAQYTYHQFTTTTLKNRDFSQSQAVHRAGVYLSLERLF